jgi:integrase/recombinase XerC
VRFDRAIDEFIRDKRTAGQINSRRTEDSYRSRLQCHADDAGDRDPRFTDRDDVKRTLRRWENPNTQSNSRAIFVSFYRWMVEEGYRTDNPAEQTRRPKRRKASIYRLKREECVALMAAVRTQRERRIIYIGLLLGLRNQELRGLQLRHFTRQAGVVWISPDIAKNKRERYIPVLPELEAVVVEILANVGPQDYVIAARRSVGGRQQTIFRETPTKICSPQALRAAVAAIAKRAGIGAHIHPHLLRHAFGDHVARQAGIVAAQAMLGHESIDTTERTYTGRITLDELAAAAALFRYDGPLPTPNRNALSIRPQIWLEAPSGLEPEVSSPRGIEPNSEDHSPLGGSHEDHQPDGDARRPGS